jgi:peptide-methionine (S)-S-oxide reductase
MNLAIFGAGCFWGVEDAFRQLDGVVATRVGYAGGTVDDPSYGEVCSGETGHTEVVEVEFDPSVVSYEQLLEFFWSQHDPTHPIMTQYRSLIVCADDAQMRAAGEAKDRLQASGKYEGAVRTAILPACPFHPAEPYHQQYYEKRRAIARECAARTPVE